MLIDNAIISSSKPWQIELPQINAQDEADWPYGTLIIRAEGQHYSPPSPWTHIDLLSRTGTIVSTLTRASGTAVEAVLGGKADTTVAWG